MTNNKWGCLNFLVRFRWEIDTRCFLRRRNPFLIPKALEASFEVKKYCHKSIWIFLISSRVKNDEMSLKTYFLINIGIFCWNNKCTEASAVPKYVWNQFGRSIFKDSFQSIFLKDAKRVVFHQFWPRVEYYFNNLSGKRTHKTP